MEQVSADGHHYHEHGVFVQKRKGHFLPQKIIVHLIEQAFAVTPVVIEFDYFKVGHFCIIGHYGPVRKAVTSKQIPLPVGVFLF